MVRTSPGDWKCPCGNWNSKWDEKCRFCGHEDPKDKSTPPVMQVKPKELIEAQRRKITKEKQEKAPKTYTKEKDKYICPNPDCLKETLSYNEEERLFVCSNPECNKKYALAEVE